MKTRLMILLTALSLSTAIHAPVSHAQEGDAQQGDDVLARGERVYEYWCATCHAAGPNMPGTAALEVKYDGALPGVLTQRTDISPEFVSAIVRTGISVMPPFRPTEISDADLAAIGRYIVTTAQQSAE